MLKTALVFACACVLIEDVSMQAPAATNVPPALVGRWLAEDIDGKGVIDDLQTTIEINDDGTFAGFAGCNSFTGTFSLGDGSILFSRPGTTRKICPPAIMDQEQKFLAALRTELEWRVEETKLSLYAGKGRRAVELVAHNI